MTHLLHAKLAFSTFGFSLYPSPRTPPGSTAALTLLVLHTRCVGQRSGKRCSNEFAVLKEALCHIIVARLGCSIHVFGEQLPWNWRGICFSVIQELTSLVVACFCFFSRAHWFTGDCGNTVVVSYGR